MRHRTFFSLEEINREIRYLLALLNQRPFKKRPGSRESLYRSLDQPALKALPGTRYEFAEWRAAVGVGPDYHVDVNRHYYSVPYTLVGAAVEARLTATMVELFSNHRRVACHARSHDAGAFTTDPAHRPEAHRKYADLTPENLMAWGRSVGESTAAVVKHLLYGKRHPQLGFKSCLSLQKMARQLGQERLEAACQRALALNSPSVKTVQSLLAKSLERRQPDGAEGQGPLPQHSNIRGAAYYQEEMAHAE